MKGVSVGIWLLACCLAGFAGDKRYDPSWKSLDSRPTPSWFSDAKFGIFIHWGVYSVPCFAPTEDVSVYARYAEWYWMRLSNPDMEGHAQFKAFHDRVYGPYFRYQDFAPMFKAELFEPDRWADLFKRSGARYVVLTSKHHEGFCLWPSSQSWNWNSVDIGPHRDLAGDLAAAVRKAGLKMGFYYSLYEWFNPLYHADVDKYTAEHMFPQMKDLVSRYRPEILWTDGEWDHTSAKWRAGEFLSWLFNESPVRETVAVNDRWGKETRGVHGGYYTTEYGLVGEKAESGTTQLHPWEECRGIGNSFGYNRAETLSDYSTPQKLIHLLVDIVSRGGNLLLDIGPTADGRIPVIMEERLLEMGEWLAVNGEAIYGTRPWRRFSEGESVRYTSRGDTLYAICLGWPDSTLVLEAPSLSPEGKIEMLGLSKPVQWESGEGGIRIDLSGLCPTDAACSHAFVFRMTKVR